MNTTEVIKMLAQKLASYQRSEYELSDHDTKVSSKIDELLFDLEDGRRMLDTHTQIFATFLINGLLPDDIDDPEYKLAAECVLLKAWEINCEKFIRILGIDWKRLEKVMNTPRKDQLRLYRKFAHVGPVPEMVPTGIGKYRPS